MIWSWPLTSSRVAGRYFSTHGASGCSDDDEDDEDDDDDEGEVEPVRNGCWRVEDIGRGRVFER